MQKWMKANGLQIDPAVLALRALAYIIAEPDLGPRLLAVTGLKPADLRAHASDPAVLSAMLAFLEDHQPSLLACAEALGVPPEALVAAHDALGR